MWLIPEVLQQGQPDLRSCHANMEANRMIQTLAAPLHMSDMEMPLLPVGGARPWDLGLSDSTVTIHVDSAMIFASMFVLATGMRSNRRRAVPPWCHGRVSEQVRPWCVL